MIKTTIKNYLFIASLFCVIGCDKEDSNNSDVKACFDYTPQTELKVGDEIAFTNCSENVTECSWSFGDGEVSNESNPKHIFQNTGDFTIKLVARNESSIDSISKTVSIEQGYGLIKQIETPGRAKSIFKSNNYIYIADGNAGGLQIVDYSDPNAPLIIGNLDTSGDALDVVVDGNYAYIADGELGGLQIIDISNKNSPVLVGSYNSAGQALELKYKDGKIYLADGFNGLNIIDVSDKQNPTFINSYIQTLPSNVPPAEVTNLFVSGNYVYISSNTQIGLEILDVTDLNNIVKLSSIVPANGPIIHEIMVVDNYCYASAIAGFSIINITDKSNPVLAGNYDGINNTFSLFVQGDYLYLTDYLQGIHQVDVVEKSSPILEISYSVLSKPQDVFVENDLAFVADFDEGIKIVKFEKY